MKEGIWNILLHKEDKDNEYKLIAPTNNPKKSGKYLCTCINYWKGEEVLRYLQIMYYDAKKNYWHDEYNASGISHNILAWTDEVDVCSFNNFNYVVGGHFVEK